VIHAALHGVFKAKPQTAVAGLLGLVLAATSPAQPHLAITGDPAMTMDLADGWSPSAVVRDEEGRITAAPFWSSHWKATGEISPAANAPPAPTMMMKQEPGRVLAWGVKEYSLEPIVIATRHAVLYIALPAQSLKSITREEKEWLASHFPKKKLRSRLTPVQVAHLYGLRYLRLEAMWRDLLCLDSWRDGFRPPVRNLPDGPHFGSRGRSEMYVFSKEEPYREFGRHFFGAAGAHASYWYHADTESVIGAFHATDLKPTEVYGRFVHLAAHDLTYQYGGYYHHMPAWIPNGIGHYFARRLGKIKNTYILNGTPENKHKQAWEWDKAGNKQNWWREAKALVKSGSARALMQLGLQTRYVELEPRLHVQSWSMVHYIIGMGKGRFRTFLDEMMMMNDGDSLLQVQQRALLRGCGVNMVQFERHWKAWVHRTKPPKVRGNRG